MFYILNVIIGSYFLLTTVAIISPAAANVCLKFYDVTEYSMNKHRKIWISVTSIIMILYTLFWFSI